MDKPLNILETIDCMVVDDSVAIRKIVRQLLEQMGVVRIREAEDSIEALERLKNSRSDVAIVDYELGTFTGVDFIRMLRTARGSPAENIGLILLTAHNDPTLEQKAREAGAGAHPRRAGRRNAADSGGTHRCAEPGDRVARPYICRHQSRGERSRTSALTSQEAHLQYRPEKPWQQTFRPA